MEYTKTQVSPCEISLDVTIDAATVRKAFGKAYQDFNQHTKVPGFRPGKAPRAVLEQYLDPERVLEHAKDLLAGPAYRDIMVTEGLNPFGDPQAEFGDLVDNTEWKFKVTVYLPPVVELGDYSGIVVERPIFEITDADIDRHIEQARGERARMVPVEGRGVQEGDVLVAEMLTVVEGEPAPEEPRRVLVRLGGNVPGFDEAIMGQQVEETRSFQVTYPEDFQDTNVAGKNADYTMKVISIHERVLPEIDDELAAEITGLKTVAEWREMVREGMGNQAAEQSERIVEGRIVDELIKRCKIEFPANMVMDEMTEQHGELLEQLQERNMTFESYLQMAQMTEEQYQQQVSERATARVIQRLVLRELIKAEGINVTNEEIDAEFAVAFDEFDPTDPSVKRLTASRRRRTTVANRLVERKLLAALTAIAEVKDVPASVGAAPQEATEE